MAGIFETYKKTLHGLGPIAYRNVVSLTNGIIFAVIIFLFYFGENTAGLFFGLVVLLNILLGFIQDARAKFALEKVQSLTAPRSIRINPDGTEESVLKEDIRKNDHLRLKYGDQLSCDGVLVTAHGLEVNEALLTGESLPIPKVPGDTVLGGSIITAGEGIARATADYRDSEISKMTEGIKEYTINQSPIQRSVDSFITYTGYVLVASIAFIIGRGYLVGEPVVGIVKNVGAITSMLVPQGLVVAAALLFTYGAIKMYQKQVLLQEINATEKLGRIKNLCIDKTGTLTENKLVVEDLHIGPRFSREDAERYIAAYIRGSADRSQIDQAMEKFLPLEFSGRVVNTIPFSSHRLYGGVVIEEAGALSFVLAGSPEIFLPHVAAPEDEHWLRTMIGSLTGAGKHVLAVVVDRKNILKEDLSQSSFAVVGLFVFHNRLRDGVREAVDFFQKRGVIIRVISGDLPETVRSVAAAAGINGTDALTTGSALATWPAAEFDARVISYRIFARVKPDQKVRIVEALKKHGFTAMIGDGANDALAVKRADLGIAMFDGAAATRKIASIVLMNNSFAALPSGARLADNIIANIEIMASLYFNLTIVGFLLFVAVSSFGYAYPLTPLNITFINYFTVGVPSLLVFYWAMRPPEKTRMPPDVPFLRRVLPYSVIGALIMSYGVVAAFALGPAYLKIVDSNTLVVLAFIAAGYLFFIFTPHVYNGITTKVQKMMFVVYGLVEIALLYLAFQIPLALVFYDLQPPTYSGVLTVTAVSAFVAVAMYALVRGFFGKRPLV